MAERAFEIAYMRLREENELLRSQRDEARADMRHTISVVTRADVAAELAASAADIQAANDENERVRAAIRDVLMLGGRYRMNRPARAVLASLLAESVGVA